MNQAEPLVIRPPARWVHLELGELWTYRELLYFLTWRDLKVRYKQTVLGVSWAVLVPLIMMVVFTLFFRGRVNSEGLAYPVFVYTGLVVWTLFANSVNLSSASLVSGSNLITKVYFPRMLVALAPVGAAIFDFGLAFLVLIPLMAYYGVAPEWSHVPAVVPLLALLLVAASGVGLLFSALMVRYRDLRYALPPLMQIWLFFSAVIVVPHWDNPWQTIYALNPMVGVVEGFRWAVADGPAPPGATMAVSTVSALVLLAAGILYFRRTEDTFADVV